MFGNPARAKLGCAEWVIDGSGEGDGCWWEAAVGLTLVL